MTRPGKSRRKLDSNPGFSGLEAEKSRRKRDSNPGSSAPEGDALTTRPARRSDLGELKQTKARKDNGLL